MVEPRAVVLRALFGQEPRWDGWGGWDTAWSSELMGVEARATQVSRVAGMLDEELEEFRSRELGEYPIVYLDAHYEKVEEAAGCRTWPS